MVWFQCEDCGDNLKKPKLANHFNMCSASKFSCIDCGANFGQQSVQGHTQCITEAEKYGPKGPGKTQNGATPKPSKDSKQHPDIDITVGLSERPPWFCSLCNTKATSQQTLLLHAEGKKHRGKARAVHASKQQSMQKEEPDSHTKLPSETPQKIELLGKKDLKESESEDISQVNSAHHNLEIENGTLPLKKRRKSDRSEDDSSRKKAKDDTSVELGNGEVIQSAKTEKDKREISTKRDNVLKSCFDKEETKKIKWKKLIKSVLKSSPDGTLKVKKLRKLVLKAFSESGTTGDETELSNTLERKINSSSKFIVENKYVRLAAKD